MIWLSKEPPPRIQLTFKGYLTALGKAIQIGLIISFGFLVLVFVRCIEYPFFRDSRPITHFVTQIVCRCTLFIIGVRCRVKGYPMLGKGAVVANHSSWLDIFALNAFQHIHFVSKAEVSNWPFVGQLAKATGTVFIERDPRQAVEQLKIFQERLKSGHRLLFFPEGTSTDGLRVLEFKSTLFAAFFEPNLKDCTYLQAVSIFHQAPKGEDMRFYGWWGEMSFAKHLLHTLASSGHGEIHITFSEPLAVSDFSDRKSLASALHHIVTEGHKEAMEYVQQR